MNEESLFVAALERPTPAERQAFLAEACGGDAALRARVELLLDADRRTRGVLEHGPDAAAEGCSPLAAGRLFAGRFKLREKLGEGGMGEVWVADQTEPVQRRVALKVVRPGLDSARLLARFEQERQALALMDHPNVAKVFDAGLDETGRPYFVMEFIKGVAFTQYCDDARLSPRERLELFLPVCHAVQHAHQKGIIHRDLKPSNILVALYDGKPVPKVIDFGVAKVTGPRVSEQSVYTEVGTLVGTLEYMSPEQAELNNLDIDTRTDVYALGVVLYELLTGGVPFPRRQLQAVAFTEMLRVIKEVDPPKPSTKLSQSETLPSVAAVRHLEPKKLIASVRGELDWIAMRCLEKDRGRRYESANGLAADLQRYLAGEPVAAGPPTNGYRLRKYARKYKTVLATLGAFAVLLLTATAVSVGLASWAIRERNHADQQKRTAEDQTRVAEANFNRAIEAVDQMLTRVSENKLVHVPQMEPIRRELLQDALRFYRQFLAEKGDDPAVRVEAAKAYKRVGMILLELGQHDESEEACRHALALLEQLSADSPDDPALTDQRAKVHHLFGMVYAELTRFPQSEQAYRQSETLLEEVERRRPDDREARLSLASARSNLVIVYRNRGALDAAVTAFEKCRTTLDDLLAADPSNAKYREHLAVCHQNVALAYAAKDKGALAEAASQKAVEIYQQLLRDQPDSVKLQKQLAQTCNNLALFYTRDNRHEKADPLYKQSLAVHEALFRDHPKVVRFAVEVAGGYGNMAMHVRKFRSAEESLEWSDKAIRTAEPLLERNPKDAYARLTLFTGLSERALAYDELGRVEDVTKDRKRLLEISEGQSHINMRLFRPSPLARLGEHAKAAAEIEALMTDGHRQGRNLYMFSYVLSVCSAAAGKDDRLPAEERERLADQYGSRAVELLRQATAAGYFKDPDRLARMKKNDDLKAISSRPDFQKLLHELEANREPQTRGL